MAYLTIIKGKNSEKFWQIHSKSTKSMKLRGFRVPKLWGGWVVPQVLVICPKLKLVIFGGASQNHHQCFTNHHAPHHHQQLTVSIGWEAAKSICPDLIEVGHHARTLMLLIIIITIIKSDWSATLPSVPVSLRQLPWLSQSCQVSTTHFAQTFLFLLDILFHSDLHCKVFWTCVFALGLSPNIYQLRPGQVTIDGQCWRSNKLINMFRPTPPRQTIVCLYYFLHNSRWLHQWSDHSRHAQGMSSIFWPLSTESETLPLIDHLVTRCVLSSSAFNT